MHRVKKIYDNQAPAFHGRFAVFLCGLIALALQCQVKLFEAAGYNGLRVNLADFILPLAGLFILYSIGTKQTRWPVWRKPFNILWPALISLIIGASLLYSHILTDSLNRWALINKGVGWVVLMAYLGAGSWLATNFAQGSLRVFLRCFIYTLLAVTTGYLALQILHGYGVRPLSFSAYQTEGLMGNRNAFAFLFLTAATFSWLCFFKKTDILNAKTIIAIGLLLPGFIFMNGSRTLWLALIILLPYLFILDFKKALRYILLPAFVGLIGFLIIAQPALKMVASQNLHNSKNLIAYSQTLSAEEQETQLNVSDSQRLESIKSSLSAWKERPIFGYGLGANIQKQKDNHSQAKIVVHNTLLWLLTDTGLIGALSFLGCYIVMLLALQKSSQNEQQDLTTRVFAHGAILMLLIFGVFSMLHEMLYTRFMWFILGLALAVPVRQTPEPAQT